MNASVVPFRRGLSKAAHVYDHLRSEIISLAREPGSRIDKTDVCEQLDVSRQPVAEALARLAEERLVEVHPQSGSFIARIRLADVEEAAFVRRAIEVEMIREIAPRADEAFLTDLSRVLEYQSFAAQIGDVAEFYQLDLRFHAALFARLGKRRPAEVVEAVRAHLERARRMLLPNPARNDETLKEHRAIVKALATHDAEKAAASMRTHLTHAIAAIRRFAAERTDLFEP